MPEEEYRPLCFVLMPFGEKTDATGRTIDFDALYEDVFRRAVHSAGMEPVRADEERIGGIIHKPMFERLLLTPFAIADLTLANANVFYELGVRHAARPHSTVLLFERGGQRLPFDVAPLRAIPYEVDNGGVVIEPAALGAEIQERLESARDPAPDSPLYQLLDGITPPDLARLKTDVFRDRVRYNATVKARLEQASKEDLDAVDAVRDDLEPLGDKEGAILVDLLLTYRDVSAYERMLSIVDVMPVPLATSVTVREQKALALNRLGRRDEAEAVLREVLEHSGPSSETYGILGRVLKDRWRDAQGSGQAAAARAHLGRAIDAYKKGFETDWRDAYPGINALTLLEIQTPNQNEFERLLPVVRYSIERRLISGGGDYWDHASLLEVAVLEGDPDTAEQELGECLAEDPPDWQLESTAGNLQLLREARADRAEDTSLLDRVLEALGFPSVSEELQG